MRGIVCLGVVAVAVALLVAGCGGSDEGVVCGRMDAALVKERLDAAGYRASLLVRSEAQSEDEAFTAVGVRLPGFLNIVVDAYCSPEIANKISKENPFSSQCCLTKVVANRTYLGVTDVQPPTPENRAAFDGVVKAAEGK